MYTRTIYSYKLIINVNVIFDPLNEWRRLRVNEVMFEAMRYFDLNHRSSLGMKLKLNEPCGFTLENVMYNTYCTSILRSYNYVSEYSCYFVLQNSISCKIMYSKTCLICKVVVQIIDQSVQCTVKRCAN